MKDTTPPERPQRMNKRTLTMRCLRFKSLKLEGSKHFKMNTASKLGPHTQTDRGTCPGVGLWVYLKRRCTTRGDDGGAHAIVRGGARCASQVLHRCALAVSRGFLCYVLVQLAAGLTLCYGESNNLTWHYLNMLFISRLPPNFKIIQ